MRPADLRQREREIPTILTKNKRESLYSVKFRRKLNFMGFHAFSRHAIIPSGVNCSQAEKRPFSDSAA